MSNPLHVALLVGLLLGYVIPAFMVGRLAARRGRSFVVYLVAGLAVGWIVPLVTALVLPNRAPQDSLS